MRCDHRSHCDLRALTFLYSETAFSLFLSLKRETERASTSESGLVTPFQSRIGPPRVQGGMSLQLESCPDRTRSRRRSTRFRDARDAEAARLAALHQAETVAFLRYQKTAQMGSTVAQQYAKICTTPFSFYIAESIGRSSVITLTLISWVWGFRAVRAPLWMSAPAIVHAATVLTEQGAVHVLGPLVFYEHPASLICVFLECVCFSFNTIYPLFLSIKDKPFGSRLAQLGLSGGVGFCGTIYVQLVIYTLLRKFGRRVNPLSVRENALIIPAMRLMRFEDGWTDVRSSGWLCQ